MFDLQKIVRKNIQTLKPYSCARDEFSGLKDAIFLDANENPYGKLNRYPDPYQKELKNAISAIKKVPYEQIFLGNGSDEAIDLAFRIFCEPKEDKILTFSPTYGMYQVSADINNVEIIDIPLNDEFQIDLEKTRAYLKEESLKIVFICSPNNPTGNTINWENIAFILQNFNGIVIVDEAYIDFSETNSLTEKINEFPNLIVLQTFSKAWGLAGVRIGMAFAQEEIIQLFNKVKPPYNISQINQEAALNTLKNTTTFEQQKTSIIAEKKRINSRLKELDFIKKVYPSDANFLLFEIENTNEIYQQMIAEKVIIRKRSQLVKNTLRVTIGSTEENNAFLQKLNQVYLSTWLTKPIRFFNLKN